MVLRFDIKEAERLARVLAAQERLHSDEAQRRRRHQDMAMAKGMKDINFDPEKWENTLTLVRKLCAKVEAAIREGHRENP